MTSAPLTNLITPKTKRLFKALDGKAMFVGGAIRDTLMGRFCGDTDIDIATPFTPDEVIAKLTAAKIKAIPTGYRHGTITALVDGATFEITSLRQDIETMGRRATVRYGTDYLIDAARRDFTVNALYADETGKIFDFLGTGLSDLKHRRLRFIGDPETRIKEDYLRILRYFRFLPQIGTKACDKQALAAIAKNAPFIPKLSKERINAEFSKILMSDNPEKILTLMKKTGVLKQIYPALSRIAKLKKVLAFAALYDLPTPLPLRLYCLCSPAHITGLKKALVLSNAQDNDLCLLCDHRKAFNAIKSHRTKAALFKYGKELCLASFCLCGGIKGDFKNHPENLYIIKEILTLCVPQFPVTGQDIVNLGIPAGKKIGIALKKLEAKWLKSDFSLSRNDLLVDLKET